MYKELGSVEIQDQIEVTKYLVDNLNFIDPRRIAVWGWSYGGYATMMAMSDPLQDLFQCGIAVAPVTNWHFYGITSSLMGLIGYQNNYLQTLFTLRDIWAIQKSMATPELMKSLVFWRGHFTFVLVKTRWGNCFLSTEQGTIMSTFSTPWFYQKSSSDSASSSGSRYVREDNIYCFFFTFHSKSFLK